MVTWGLAPCALLYEGRCSTQVPQLHPQDLALRAGCVPVPGRQYDVHLAAQRYGAYRSCIVSWQRVRGATDRQERARREKVEAILEDYAAGVSVRVIAKAARCSRERVYQILREEGVLPKRKDAPKRSFWSA